MPLFPNRYSTRKITGQPNPHCELTYPELSAKMRQSLHVQFPNSSGKEIQRYPVFISLLRLIQSFIRQQIGNRRNHKKAGPQIARGTMQMLMV